jgi:hypothetical protein
MLPRTARLCAALFVVSIAGVFSVSSTSATPVSRPTVLLVGDSVTANIRLTGDAQKVLNRSKFRFISETYVCQVLLRKSCNSQRTASALNQVKKHRTSNVNFIVVNTGYNDSYATDVRKAVKSISAEAQLMGAHLIWLTYHDGGYMKGRASKFNRVLRQEAKINGMTILNWAAHAKGRTKWYTRDRVHMNRTGGVALATFIRNGITSYIRSTTTTTTTTTVPETTTTVPETTTTTVPATPAEDTTTNTTTTVETPVPAG